MLFIVKFFPEIIIKSKPVRKKMSRRLQDNLLAQLRPVAPNCIVKNEWDKMTVEITQTEPEIIKQCLSILKSTSGITYFLEVIPHAFTDI